MANLLKISGTYTETKFIDKEIDLPYYFKDRYDYLTKVVSETHGVQVSRTKNYWSACVVPISYMRDKIALGTPITADEFDAAYSQAMMYVDLINRNEDPSNEIDENVQIDQMMGVNA